MSHNFTLIDGGVVNHAHVPLKASPSPTISPREFKDAMANLVFTVAVATASHAGEQNRTYDHVLHAAQRRTAASNDLHRCQ